MQIYRYTERRITERIEQIRKNLYVQNEDNRGRVREKSIMLIPARIPIPSGVG